MTVQYSKSANGRRYARYVCAHAASTRGEPICSGLSAPHMDDAIVLLTLRALEPAAIEMSLQVSADIERERQKAEGLWQKRLQRARYEAERAQRQYQAVEPENRLVARTLERAWEEKLHAERALLEDHRRQQERRPQHLTEQERTAIRSLAEDLPTLWAAPTTTPSDRKAVLQLVIDRVVATVDQTSEWVDVSVRWAGGHQTDTRIQRPVGKLVALGQYQKLLGEIRRLRSDGYSASEIAKQLNNDGWVTPTQRNSFNERLVRAIVYRHGAGLKGSRRPPSEDPNEQWLKEVARELAMPVVTLYGWLHRGWLRARRVRGQWAITATATELRRLRELRAQTSRFGTEGNAARAKR